MINVREYARLAKVSPPTASKVLSGYMKEKLLVKEEDKGYFLYYANRNDEKFLALSRLYWGIKLNELLDHLEDQFLNPVIFLFGSLSKAEAKQDSDIDLAIFTSTKKELNLEKFEKKIRRKIQLFIFKNRTSVKNKELLNNILNGEKFRGSWL